jgi:hypothetical protein
MWKVRPLTLSIDQPMSDKADIQPGCRDYAALALCAAFLFGRFR